MTSSVTVESTIDKCMLSKGSDFVPWSPAEEEMEGSSGCMLRQGEWKTGVTYHNDDNAYIEPRYQDIVVFQSDTAASGLDAYRCLVTHTSDASNHPQTGANRATYWDKFNNVDPVITPIIMAKNSIINFMQGNKLLVQDANGNVAAGMVAEDVCIWSGASYENKANAPFSVTRAGEVHGSKMTIDGDSQLHNVVIDGTTLFKGIIKCFDINVNSTTVLNTYFSYSGGRYNLLLNKVASSKVRITFNLASNYSISLPGIQKRSNVGTYTDIRDYLGCRILFVNNMPAPTTGYRALNFYGAVHDTRSVVVTGPIITLNNGNEIDLELKTYNKTSYIDFEWESIYQGVIMQEK